MKVFVLIALALCGCAHRAPRVRPISPESRTAIERAVREMREATRDTVFPPTKILP